MVPAPARAWSSRASTPLFLHHSSPPLHAAPTLPPPLRPDTAPSSVRSLAAGLTIALLLGVSIAYGTKRASASLPPEVKECLIKASELQARGAPMSAAAQMERALNILAAGGYDNLLVVEVMFRLGDLQQEAKQHAKSRDTFMKTAALCAALHKASTKPGAPASDAARKLLIKQARALDRASESCESDGDIATACSLTLQAMRLVALPWADTVKRQLQACGVYVDETADSMRILPRSTSDVTLLHPHLTEAERYELADIAGLYYNCTYMHRTHAHAAVRATTTLSESQSVYCSVVACAIITGCIMAALEDAIAMMHAVGHDCQAQQLIGACMDAQATFRDSHGVSGADLRRAWLRDVTACANEKLSHHVASQLRMLSKPDAHRLAEELDTLTDLQARSLRELKLLTPDALAA
ncbi:hypothetical protein EON62_00350 [archaeon]|nr:MAG: hypothetical protein EON62_00350 [archaeon]